MSVNTSAATDTDATVCTRVVARNRSPLEEHFTPDELEAWKTLMPLVRVQAILDQTTRREMGEVVDDQKADEDWPYTGISY